VLDPQLAPPILALHAALDLDTLWHAMVKLLDAAIPVNDLIAALPYEGVMPMTFRTTVVVEDMHAYRIRMEKAGPPMAQVIASSPGLRTTFLDDHMPEAQLLSSPFYREVMEPDGVRHLAGLLFWNDKQFIAHIGINRTAAQGPFTPAERELLDHLHPHLAHAITRVSRLDSQHAVIKMLQHALDHPMEGLVLLDSKEQIVFHNAAAADACAWWRGGRTEALMQSRQSSSFVLPPELRQHASALLNRFREHLSQPQLAHPADPLEEHCSHPSIKGLQATLAVIAPPNQAVPPHVRIRITRMSKDQKGLPLHLLTHAEHRTAHLAADGLRNEDIATYLGISVNTVRAHLRSVFDKLGIDHRGELVSHFK